MSLRRFANVWSRRLHRWGALLAVAPVLVVLVTGLLLQVKKEFSWIQPEELRGVGGAPALSLGELVEIASGVEEAGIGGLDDVDRIDYRADRGVAKVRSRTSWEVQIDTATGDVLGSAYRRSDLIESLHDGSWFGDGVKMWVFLPAGVVLLGLWLTGVYLWILPLWARRAGRRRRAARASGVG